MPFDSTDTSHDFFSVTYRIKPNDGVTPEQMARDIAEEQTIEIPHESIPQLLIDNGIVGEVTDVYREEDGFFSAEIRFRNDTTAYTAPQFLNVLFGNSSLKKNIRITKLMLSPKLLAAFGGPQSGGEGVRRCIGVYGRPLLCTALKPMGLSNEELAGIAGECAHAGVDLIKDDHGLGDQPFNRFEDRVARVAEAVAAADAKTGNRTLYFPNLCGPREDIERQISFAVRYGIRAVLLSPQLVGFDAVRFLADKYGLIVMAHPAFTGSLFTSENGGMAPELFLGTFFRMIGADISIFPSWGGRFPFTREECTAIAAALTGSMPPLRSALPAPAGGIRFENIPAIADAYGSESVLLVGGALLGSTGNAGRSVGVFLDALRERFGEQRRPSEAQFGSSCEIPGAKQENGLPAGILRYENGGWNGRRSEEYKPDRTAAFSGITRTELIGKSGVSTGFDLRYFEIGPGGNSSLEKHLHEHVIIGVRGTGVLIKKGERFNLHPNDIAYIGPLETHQLRNEQDAPFGFYCIVDHQRDHPQPVYPS